MRIPFFIKINSKINTRRLIESLAIWYIVVYLLASLIYGLMLEATTPEGEVIIERITKIFTAVYGTAIGLFWWGLERKNGSPSEWWWKQIRRLF